MAENDVVRFPGNLDPSAQEFRPTFIPHHHNFPFSPPPQQPPFFPEFLYSPPPPPQHPPLSYMTPALLPPSIPPPASTPTRALLLTAVPPDVSESIVRRELEIFGDVRAVQMGRVSEGIVTVHFYDLRAAHAALDAVREQHMQHQNRLRLHYSSILARTNSGPFVGPPPTPPPSPGLISGRAVWAQFTIPATNAFPDGQNQGTLVVFNLNPTVSALTLKNIFQSFGAVKELRETPMKRQQRFVEFYDVRDASRALVEMNGKEINGRSVMIEFSRPGGHSNKKFNNHHFTHHFNQSPNLNYHQQHLIKQPISSPSPPSSLFPLRNRRTSPKQNVRRRRSSPMSSEESLDVAMTGLTLRGNAGNTKPNAIRKGGKNGNCSSSGSSLTTSTKQQPQQGQSSTGGSKAKPWKGRQKNFDPRFLIKEEAIVDDESGCKDTRTTIMIKNIPNKYSQKLVLNMLDNHCIHCNEQIAVAGDNQPLSSYDFVYLPIDFNNKCNVGYGFVNMTSPEATLRLYKSFHHQHWEVFNSRKICEVTYARVQGLEALKEHFKNSKFACENDEYLPVVFTPPRDGQNLTDPLPIVFSNTAATSTHQHLSTDIDASDFTSTTTSTCTTTTTSPTTLTHPDELYDHIDSVEHIILNPIITESDDDNDNDDDERSTSSSNGGGGGSSNSSMMMMGCSTAD
ncbi:protein terminal ear1-like [Chenopodium quinoa]|uniref:protein terminal ear1-like n=1 Tax=Chenopodium quinoa TaxID=63459 RepID=UPI000B78D18C|nr:protein terminal ear1-like [Chenopodium quinoa]